MQTTGQLLLVHIYKNVLASFQIKSPITSCFPWNMSDWHLHRLLFLIIFCHWIQLQMDQNAVLDSLTRICFAIQKRYHPEQNCNGSPLLLSLSCNKDYLHSTYFFYSIHIFVPSGVGVYYSATLCVDLQHSSLLLQTTSSERTTSHTLSL